MPYQILLLDKAWRAIGTGVEIGGNGILRTGAIVRAGVKMGRSCELGWARLYGEDVPAKTYFDPRYDNPISVYGT